MDSKKRVFRRLAQEHSRRHKQALLHRFGSAGRNEVRGEEHRCTVNQTVAVVPNPE